MRLWAPRGVPPARLNHPTNAWGTGRLHQPGRTTTSIWSKSVRQAPARVALLRAKARLDPLALYERPVRIEHVRIISVGWIFRLPWFRRFDGYTMWNLILLRSPELGEHDELICHELCHVWQMQHRPVRMPLSYLRFGYEHNPYEEEARQAAGSAGSRD